MTISFKQYLTDQLEAKRIDTALAGGLEAIANSCMAIAHAVARGALDGILGSAGTGNVQGETQKQLDVLANDQLLRDCAASGSFAGIASEEMDDAQATGANEAKYLLLFDPLDGSSNIDVNVSIGTIFSILPFAGGDAAAASAYLQAGSAQVASGYAIYGPQTTFVLTIGHGVQAFTLDPDERVFMQTEAAMNLPATTQEFSINMSNQRHWEAPVKRYIDELLAGKTGPRGRDFNMRWIASMVADTHRILSRGGVFLYPRDAREPNKPGKLRLLYEANPMSLLIEQAGGAATNGHQRILSIKPAELHQRVAVILGNREEVDRVSGYHGNGGKVAERE